MWWWQQYGDTCTGHADTKQCTNNGRSVCGAVAALLDIFICRWDLVQAIMERLLRRRDGSKEQDNDTMVVKTSSVTQLSHTLLSAGTQEQSITITLPGHPYMHTTCVLTALKSIGLRLEALLVSILLCFCIFIK